MDARPRKYITTKRLDNLFLELAGIYAFTIKFFREAFLPPYEFREFIKQCYQVGYKSLPLISLTGFITGIVFTNQSRPSLADFGATSWLPALISIAIIRALAPLVTALIAAGKVGSNIGAELRSEENTSELQSLMRISDAVFCLKKKKPHQLLQ